MDKNLYDKFIEYFGVEKILKADQITGYQRVTMKGLVKRANEKKLEEAIENKRALSYILDTFNVSRMSVHRKKKELLKKV